MAAKQATRAIYMALLPFSICLAHLGKLADNPFTPKVLPMWQVKTVIWCHLFGQLLAHFSWYF